MKTIKYYNSSDSTQSSVLYDIDYDLATGDFFYLGESSTAQFVSRTSSLGSHVWIKYFSQEIAAYSLVYLESLEKVFFVLRNPLSFVLVNSTNGNYIRISEIGGQFTTSSNNHK